MNSHSYAPDIERASALIGHAFADPALLSAALTHPSAAESQPVNANYERLEFLGDAILGSIVAEELYLRFPNVHEGELTRIKTALVAGATLSDVADELGIGPYIIFGDSERGTSSRGLHSALENVYEAIVGALYLDGGIAAARAFVLKTLSPMMDGTKELRPPNAKSRLQEITQRDLHCAPEYKLVGEEGPKHTPTFTAVVLVQGIRVGRGSGSTKKAAETAAAQHAIERLTAGTAGQIKGSVLAHPLP